MKIADLPAAFVDDDPLHSGLFAHFFVQMGLAADAQELLNEQSFGRMHHRILCMAHYVPGITVGELLGVLRTSAQSIQRAMRDLIREKYVTTRTPLDDRRVKLLYSTPKGQRLVDEVSIKQRERFARAFAQLSERDIEGYFAVNNLLIDDSDRPWLERLKASRVEDRNHRMGPHSKPKSRGA